MENTDAETIVQRVLSAFPDPSARPSPEQVEAVMRPFGVISLETERKINELLHAQGKSTIHYGINSWMEANFVVSGEGPNVERRIQFLMMDTCTCVLDHLPAAIKHASKPVDPRILGLLEHEYLKKKQ